MLKMALLKKGIVANSHYGFNETHSTNPSPQLSISTPTPPVNLGDQSHADDDGVYL